MGDGAKRRMNTLSKTERGSVLADLGNVRFENTDEGTAHSSAEAGPVGRVRGDAQRRLSDKRRHPHPASRGWLVNVGGQRAVVKC